MLRIVRVLAPNPGVYTLEGTNTWVVGVDPAVVIDPGPADAGHLEEVARTAVRVAAVLVTHDHEDHAEGALRFGKEVDAPVHARRLDGAEPLADGQRFAAGAAEVVTVVLAGAQRRPCRLLHPHGGCALHGRRRARPRDELHRSTRRRSRRSTWPRSSGCCELEPRTIHPRPWAARDGRSRQAPGVPGAPAGSRAAGGRRPAHRSARRWTSWSRRSTGTIRPMCGRSPRGRSPPTS